MNQLSHRTKLAFAIGLVAASQFAANADEKTNSRRDEKQLQSVVSERKAELSRILHLAEKKVVSTAEVENARLAYLDARTRLELSETDLTKMELQADLESVVDILDGRLNRVLRLEELKTATSSEVDDARILLAEAKTRVDLARIVSIRQRQLARTQALQKQRAASVSEVDCARARLVEAAQQFKSFVSMKSAQ